MNEYDVNRMMFSAPAECSVPNSPITYQRIYISTKNNDMKTSGDLIIVTEPLFSFGVQENKSMDSGKVNGYVLPLCMWGQRNPTDAEVQWTDKFNEICEYSKKYLVEHRGEFKKWDLEMADLKKFNPLYWKKDKETGKVVEGRGPVLYVKLMKSSILYDAHTGEELDPLDILDKRCHVTAAIKIESVYIGNRLSLQVKLYEAEITMQSNRPKRLLRPNSTPSIAPSNDDEYEYEYEEESYEEDDGSIEVSDEEPVSNNTRSKKSSKTKK